MKTIFKSELAAVRNLFKRQTTRVSQCPEMSGVTRDLMGLPGEGAQDQLKASATIKEIDLLIQ
jgi:hypothetical protein